MEITKEAKTIINHKLGITEYENDFDDDVLHSIVVTINHEEELYPFSFNVTNLRCGATYQIDVLENLKKVIDKALKVHKAGK